jgi:cytidylate kinase
LYVGGHDFVSAITISRQYGSLGDEIGRDVAERLGLRLVDGSVIAEIARGLGLSASDFEDREEWQGTVVSDLVRRMRHLYPATIAPAPTDEPPELDDSSYLEVIRQVIWEVARTEDAVIIGRGAQSILGSSPTVLHVLVIAPLAVRTERIMTVDNLDHQRAVQRIKQIDERRARYIRRFYGADWLDVNAYDLMINTGHFSQLSAVQLICDAATPTGSMDSNNG